MERTGMVTFKGNNVTLVGQDVHAGGKAPDFILIDRELKEVGLADFRGKLKIISVAASLDTSVCDTQARRFNEEAAKLPQEVVIINVSMDLPFAIDRFCATAGIDRVVALSDHRDASFGLHYGVLIKELRLLARSVFVIDNNDIIQYQEIVPEVGGSVDFKEAINAAQRLLAGR